jgi:6-phosphofructokinase 1
MIIIPEMFNRTKITFDKIIRLVISSLIKRKLLGIDYGAAIISEGVFHFMSEKEIIDTGINFTFDDHGHPELGNVSKSHIFNMLTQQALKELKINIKSRPEEMGYELRCCRPVAYDLNYATRLGLGVYKLFKNGNTGCMVTVDRNGSISPLYLKDVEDEKGKVKPRLVNVETEKAQLIFRNNLHYITKADYEKARKYLPNPEDYDFFRILDWDETLAN